MTKGNSFYHRLGINVEWPEGHTSLPNAVIRLFGRLGLSSSQVHLLVILASYSFESENKKLGPGKCNPGLKSLCEDMGHKGRSSVIRLIWSLEGKDYYGKSIEGAPVWLRVERIANKNNVYDLSPMAQNCHNVISATPEVVMGSCYPTTLLANNQVVVSQQPGSCCTTTRVVVSQQREEEKKEEKKEEKEKKYPESDDSAGKTTGKAKGQAGTSPLSVENFPDSEEPGSGSRAEGESSEVDVKFDCFYGHTSYWLRDGVAVCAVCHPPVNGQVVMDTEKVRPWDVLALFSRLLEEAGCPKEFDSSKKRELGFARTLLQKAEAREIKAILGAYVATYVRDEFGRNHNRSLGGVLKHLDDVRSKAAVVNGYATSWDEL